MTLRKTPCWALLVAAFAGKVSPATAASAPDAATRARVRGAYGRLPLAFEANRGQADPRVRVLSRGAGYTLFLTSTEAVLSLTKPAAPPVAAQTAVIRMKVLGVVFQLVVSDGSAESEPDQVSITVRDLNQPPSCELAQAGPGLLWATQPPAAAGGDLGRGRPRRPEPDDHDHGSDAGRAPTLCSRVPR